MMTGAPHYSMLPTMHCPSVCSSSQLRSSHGWMFLWGVTGRLDLCGTQLLQPVSSAPGTSRKESLCPPVALLKAPWRALSTVQELGCFVPPFCLWKMSHSHPQGTLSICFWLGTNKTGMSWVPRAFKNGANLLQLMLQLTRKQGMNLVYKKKNKEPSPPKLYVVGKVIFLQRLTLLMLTLQLKFAVIWNYKNSTWHSTEHL